MIWLPLRQLISSPVFMKGLEIEIIVELRPCNTNMDLMRKQII